MKRFLKYSLVGFLFANIPFIGWGVIMGWPAVLLTAVALTALHGKLIDLNRLTLFFSTVGICLISTILNALWWGIYSSSLTAESIGGFTVLALIPILLSSATIAFFHRTKLVRYSDCEKCCPNIKKPGCYGDKNE
jgi:hypothetical protein